MTLAPFKSRSDVPRPPHATAATQPTSPRHRTGGNYMGKQIQYQCRCAYCRNWVSYTTYHPAVRLAFGSKPVGGFICLSCFRYLQVHPITP
jgi:hypothetical protein